MSKILARVLIAMLSAAAAYGVGCILWMFGCYFAVFPALTAPFDFKSLLRLRSYSRLGISSLACLVAVAQTHSHAAAANPFRPLNYS